VVGCQQRRRWNIAADSICKHPKKSIAFKAEKKGALAGSGFFRPDPSALIPLLLSINQKRT
jgi:hypothetical protein